MTFFFTLSQIAAFWGRFASSTFSSMAKFSFQIANLITYNSSKASTPSNHQIKNSNEFPEAKLSFLEAGFV